MHVVTPLALVVHLGAGAGVGVGVGAGVEVVGVEELEPVLPVDELVGVLEAEPELPLDLLFTAVGWLVICAIFASASATS